MLPLEYMVLVNSALSKMCTFFFGSINKDKQKTQYKCVSKMIRFPSEGPRPMCLFTNYFINKYLFKVETSN